MASQDDLAACETYKALMIEAKVRALSINSLANDQRGIPSPLVREYGILQIRMLCEIIGLGCLVAHGDLVKQSSGKLTRVYAPGEIFAALDKLHDDFFPVPMRPEKTATGWHMAEYDGAPYLTKSEVGKIWARCGEILHRGTLKHLLKNQNPVQNSFVELNDWGQKIINLLSNHRIIRVDRQLALIAFLNVDANGGEVVVALGEADPFVDDNS